VRKRKKKDTEVKARASAEKKSAEPKRPFGAKVERLREILKFVGIGYARLLSLATLFIRLNSLKIPGLSN
jgi:hypothetical protein